MKRRFFSLFFFYNLFIPLKRNGLLFALFTSLVFFFLRKEYYGETSQFTPFLNVFAWLFGLAAVLIIGFGFLYALFCWIYFVAKSKRMLINLSIGLEDGQKGEAGLVPLTLTLSQVLMPLIGYLKAWVVFEDGEIVGPIVIHRFAGGWKDLLYKEGAAQLNLTKRSQYQVKGYVFSFEDYLQFFRFSFFKRYKKTFYLYSKQRDVPTTDIPPSKAREELEKVQTSKRVEGDFLNYKDFESGDDVRRIVWKIFAKNKELVVRIPEVINPFASHVHLFASFENSLLDHTSRYASGMLDYYKDIIFNTCLQIEKTGRKIEFSMDQVVGDGLIVDRKDQLAYFLSCANWKSDSLIDQFPSIGTSSVVCVSSLIPAEDLEALIRQRTTVFFIVRVSKYLDEQNVFNPANLVVRKDSQSELSKLRWMLSSQRRKVRQNEKQISQLIESEHFQGQLI